MRLQQHEFNLGAPSADMAPIPEMLSGDKVPSSHGVFASALWGTRSRNSGPSISANALWGTISAEDKLRRQALNQYLQMGPQAGAQNMQDHGFAETMTRASKRLMVFALFIVLNAGWAHAKQKEHISKDLLCSSVSGSSASTDGKKLAVRCSNNEMVDVIVQFAPGSDAKDFEREVGNKGGAGKMPLDLIRAKTFHIPIRAAEALAKHKSVSFISPDRPVASTMDNVDLVTSTVGANTANYYGYNGAGVSVAVIDSGVSNHTDFIDLTTGYSRLVYRESFVGNLSNTSDEYGHGTHVAGIIAGTGYVSRTGYFNNSYAGVAPRAYIVSLKVLDATGAGTDSAVIAAIQRAIQLKDSYRIKVLNLSVGRPIFESYQQDPLDQAVEAAYKAGITVVVAAGNSGRDTSVDPAGHGTITAPGNDPYVITVGATNMVGTPWMSDDLVASYSSRGPSQVDHIVKPDLVAPGNAVISTNAKYSTLSTQNPKTQVFSSDNSCSMMKAYCAGQAPYLQLSGTSMATPVVAGAAALLLQQDPTLTPDQVKARLMKNAWKGYPTSAVSVATNGQTFNTQYDVFTVGAGYLDVNAALGDWSKGNGVALSPTAVLNADGTVSFTYPTVTGQTILWGTSSLSADTILWGTSAIWGDRNVGASTILWGTSNTTADTILWGTSSAAADTILWGTSAATADTILWGTSSSSGDTILWGTNGDDLEDQ